MAEPEQRLEEALRARASGAGGGRRPSVSYPVVAAPGVRTGTALLLALLCGAVLGVLLALLSLLAPGVLPG